MKPKLLDLFCKAGGATKGYQRAGFYVVGVDIDPQPNYCGDEFHLADALGFPLDGYDAYHASPPCQAYSEATPITTRGSHPKLIGVMQSILVPLKKPYVIENVEGSRWHLASPIMLCGSMFGLGVWRHRWFEVWPCYFLSPYSCNHIGHPVTVNPPSNARKSQGGRNFEKEKVAMGIDWMDKNEISQAIPPAYTEYIGKYLLQAIKKAQHDKVME